MDVNLSTFHALMSPTRLPPSTAMRMQRLFFTAALLLACAAHSQADLILFSNFGQSDDDAVSFNNSKVRFATDFLTDGTPRTIASIAAVIDSTDTSENEIQFSIFTDVGGAPGELLSFFDTVAIIPAGASGTFTATSTGIDVEANTIYWLIGQIAAPVRDAKVVNWHFSNSQVTDGGPFVAVPETEILGGNHGETTFAAQNTGNLLFVLNSLDEQSAVPEPSALVLMTLTLGVVACRRLSRNCNAGR